MTRRQKLLLSMLGSILLHCVLVAMLLSGVLLPNMRATSDAETIPEPEEVVILLSDILPESLDDDGEREKMFVRTDPDSESDEAPASPQFESDRNTLAATELLPEPVADAIDGMPTIEGRVDMPGLELRDRDFADGNEDRIELPAPGSQALSVPANSSGQLASAVPTPQQQQQAADSIANSDAGNADPSETSAKPMGDDGKGEAEGAVESSVVAEELQRPSEPTNDASVEEEVADASSNPLAGNVPVVMTSDGDNEDPEMETKKPAPTALVGSPSGPTNSTAKTDSDSPPGSAADPEGAANSGSNSPPGGAMAASSSSQASAESTAFNPETRANHVSGTLSNLGDKASVDALGTELGRYKQGVVTAVEKSWHRFRLSNRDDVTAGHLRLRFRIDSSGQVRNLKILRNEANIGMTEFTLKAILAADIPAMPKDVAGLLGSSGLVMNYTILVAY